MRVKLGDVAVESRETYKGSQQGVPIVGLEHLSSEDVNLTEWDVDTENTFSKRFRKGQVLFGRRRAYLKKAAVAPCDGICSGDITVIASKSGAFTPELLPFLIQNDRFFDFAMEKSAGSLSPRAKWEHLREFEFDLPSMDEQRNLAKVLWAFDNTRQAYKKLIKSTDELVKSQFVEMFGDVKTNPKGWEEKRLDQITDQRLDKMLDAKKQTGENRYPYLANFNVQWFRFDLTELNHMDFDEADNTETVESIELMKSERVGGRLNYTAVYAKRGARRNDN
jgi:type I restriction enzyme S subunit